VLRLITRINDVVIDYQRGGSGTSVAFPERPESVDKKAPNSLTLNRLKSPGLCLLATRLLKNTS